jgi:hypothetical protein
MIKFLNAKNVRPAEIYRQVCEVYGVIAMSDEMVRRWCRMSSEGRTNAQDDDRSGRPSLVTAELTFWTRLVFIAVNSVKLS